MKAYKGFNIDLTCSDFQYKECETIETSEIPKVYRKGFHANEYPLDCISYYRPNESVYHEVEILGDVSKKYRILATNCIKIGAKVNFDTLAKLSDEYITERIKKDDKKSAHKTKDNTLASNSRKHSTASNSGDYSTASNSGDYSTASNCGNYSMASNSGYQSVACNSGYRSVACNCEDASVACNSGGNSVASNSGECSVASNSGGCSVASY